MASYTAKDVLGGLFGGVVRNMDEHRARQLALEEAQRTAPLKRQALQGLLGYFQSSAPTQGGLLAAAGATPEPATSANPAPAPRSFPTIRDLAGPLAQAEIAGLDVGGLVNVLDKTAPEIDVANGVAFDRRATAPGTRIGVNLQPVNSTMVDPNDPNNVNRFIPKVPDGAVPLYDGQGNVVATKLLDGTIQAVGALAGAEAGARKAAEAPYSFVNVPMPDGSTQFVSQADLVRNLLPPGAGRSQTPADRVSSEGMARREVDIATNLPKAAQAMETMNRTTDEVIQAIDKALEQTGPASAGLGSLTGFIPGSPAKNLDAILDTIRANVGFDRLDEMRANSPTGGALGSITERELALLSSVAGSLNQGQSPEQLQDNLKRIRSSLSRVRQQRMAAFEQQYGGVQRPAATGGFSRAQLEAEARRRGLIR